MILNVVLRGLDWLALAILIGTALGGGLVARRARRPRLTPRRRTRSHWRAAGALWR